jgi:cell wall-associated NlpC family hydrolase
MSKHGVKVFFRMILMVSLVISSLSSISASAASIDTDIISLTKSYLGTPYAKPAASSEEGFDSSGFLYYTYKNIGYEIPRSLLSQFNMQGRTILNKDELQLGDALFFSKHQKPEFAGIYIGNQQLIMASAMEGEVVVRDFSSYYQDVFIGAKRILNERDIIKAGLVLSAQKYLGVPYLFGAKMGQTRTFDCSSLMKTIFQENGITLPRVSRDQAKIGKYVSKKELISGDLVFFTTRESGSRIGHVGLYVGDGMMIHTYGANGVEYKSINKDWWKEHYVTARRIF